jgi:D-glycero-alpha-D-manno-heptose 1-phosphate guanylyltransferase
MQSRIQERVITVEAIILAGGLGTRLRGVLPDLPKPMAPIDGRPFLEHQMDYWVKQGVERFILSVGYMSECIKAHFGNHYNGCEIAYAEEITPLGTGGGLLLALEKLQGSGPCLVLNGDTFFEVGLKDLMDFHYSHKSTLSVALFEVAANDRYMGVQVREDGEIISFKSDLGASQLANGGVYLIDKKQFTQFPWHAGDKLSLEDDLFAYLLESGQKLYGMVSSGSFIDIGVPADYFRAKDVVGVLGAQQ